MVVAKTFLGQPYVWGGESLTEGGYDCSGFVYKALNMAGYEVPRSTAQGYRTLGKKISYAQAQEGDLIFFGSDNEATHIAIFAGNGKMYESIGGKKNTKANPGKGVTLSNVSRRKDLIEVRTLFDDVEAPTVKAAATESAPYVVGQSYTLQVELKVRTGAGTNFPAKAHGQLTSDGMKHDKDGDGALDEGTKVTCKSIQYNGNDIWMQTPSGWLAAKYNGNTYIK
ncbi:MAG TPA: C40 family peptidase [Bacteroidales bacterium]|nr:C40 family peptidase [Bacteroidales bacterium]